MCRLSIRIIYDHIPRLKSSIWEILTIRCKIIFLWSHPVSTVWQYSHSCHFPECPVRTHIAGVDHKSTLGKACVLQRTVYGRICASRISERICNKYIAVYSCLTKILSGDSLHPVPARLFYHETSAIAVKYILYTLNYTAGGFQASAICCAVIIHSLAIYHSPLKARTVLVQQCSCAVYWIPYTLIVVHILSHPAIRVHISRTELIYRMPSGCSHHSSGLVEIVISTWNVKHTVCLCYPAAVWIYSVCIRISGNRMCAPVKYDIRIPHITDVDKQVIKTRKPQCTRWHPAIFAGYVALISYSNCLDKIRRLSIFQIISDPVSLFIPSCALVLKSPDKINIFSVYIV